MAHVAVLHSEADQKIISNFIKQLNPLIRSKIIRRIWYSNLIKAGERTIETTQKELSNSNIIVILITSDFFVSDDCYAALEFTDSLYKEKKYLEVIPVVCRECAWQECNILGSYRIITLDKNTPIKDDDSFTEAINVIKGAVNRVRETYLADHYYLKKTTFNVILIRFNDFFFTYKTWKRVLSALFKITIFALMIVVVIAIGCGKLSETQLVLASVGSLFISTLAYTITDIFQEKWKSMFTLQGLFMLIGLVFDQIKEAIGKIVHIPEIVYDTIKKWISPKNGDNNSAGL